MILIDMEVSATATKPSGGVTTTEGVLHPGNVLLSNMRSI
jgi:hypothetical protein